MDLEHYVKQHLSSALNNIIESDRADELPNLTIYEKAIIFAYTDVNGEQHQILNEKLRASKGADVSDFGHHLEATLAKLEDYEDLVFRGVDKDYCDVQKYIKAKNTKTSVTEYQFLSASKFQIIAQGFGHVLFRIYAKRAKDIEKVSKFVREKEVIFQKCTSFKVMYVTDNGFSTIITLKEI